MSYRARTLAEDAEPFAWQQLGAWTPAQSGSFERAHNEQEQQARLAVLEREAFAKGYEQGERAGIDAAAVRTDAMLKRLSQTIEDVASLRREIIRRSERQTVQLVLAIAE